MTQAYATGLLPVCAHLALHKLGLGDKYEAITELDGTLKLTETIDEEYAPRPFKCYLDVGLKRTSTGSRHGVFSAMKGAIVPEMAVYSFLIQRSDSLDTTPNPRH
jgi:large subunit ribosomal protein L5e